MRIEIPSTYIKVGINIRQGDRVKLLDEGKYNDIKGTDGKMKKVLQFQLQLPSGDIKTYTMNITTQKALILAFGDDTTDWTNKPLQADIVKQMAYGKITDVLVLTPIEPPKVSRADIPVVEEEEYPKE